MTFRWGVIAGLTLVPVLAFAQEKPATIPSELSWVPPSSTAFVHIKFAELWDSSFGKTIRDAITKSDPKMFARAEQALGVRLAQIDRLTLLLPDTGANRGLDNSLVMRVTTTEPYDRRQVMAALDIDNALAGQNLFELQGHREMVHLTGPRELTYLFDREGAVGLLGRLLEARSTGPLEPALKAASGPEQIIAGLDISQLSSLRGDDAPPLIRPLLEGKLAILRASLPSDRTKGATAQLTLNVRFARPGHASEGAEAINALKGELIRELETVAKELTSDKGATGRIKLVETAIAALKAAKVEARDNEVVGSTSMATEEPLRILANEGVAALRITRNRQESQNNLKQIALALHNYADVNGRLPPAAIVDKNGKPLLSWRVLILPFIEQDNLFRQFKLDEPWDSAHNLPLSKTVVKTFQLPGKDSKEPWNTHYRVLVGNGAFFNLRQPTRFADVADGLSNTIMVAEAEEGVPWAKPDELEYDPKVLPKFGYHFNNCVNVAFGDGSVRALRKGLPERTLHLLIQRSDGMPVQID